MADTKGALKKDRRPGSSSCLSHFPFSRAGAGALAPTSFPALHGPKPGKGRGYAHYDSRPLLLPDES